MNLVFGVTVGGIGRVYTGYNEGVAKEIFEEYKGELMEGNTGATSVWLMRCEEIIDSYFPCGALSVEESKKLAKPIFKV
jgi:hypothetical protein